jgi:cell division protein FtsQ
MWDDAKALNGLAATLALMATIALAGAGIAWVVRQPVFAFREVVVSTPVERASTAHLESVIREELAGTFFTLNLDRARASIARVPWVRSVALRRHWPPRLEVAVEEHEPLARWGDAGLVNRQGETFAAAWNGELPVFDGPEGESREMTERYRDWSARLAPLALVLDRVMLSARGGWSLRTHDAKGPLTIELGRDEVDARLGRFVNVYPRTLGALTGRGTRVDYVDLRYRNGFAARVPSFKEKAPRKPA